MSDRELEEYIKKVEPRFNSHLEKGTIEMSNEYYGLLEERIARLINENQKYKEVFDKANKFIEENCYEHYDSYNDEQYDILESKKELLDILKEVK